MGLMIYSCNEKISPELESGNSTTVPSITAPDEYYFRVVNNSPTVLNYKLHRTGTGNATKECSVSSTSTAFSSDLYIGDIGTSHDSKAYDISCFMEAEELSLYYNGLDFGIEASKNTCEYVAYSPYSYFDAIPGSSTATYVGTRCVEGEADDLDAATLSPATYGGGNPLRCEYMVDTSVAEINRVPRKIPTDYQAYCAFDYATNSGGNGQNCDTGRMTIDTITVYLKPNVDPTLPGEISSKDDPQETHECGGSIAACVEGPIKQIDPDGMRVSDILNTTLNTNFSKDYSLPKLKDVRTGMYDIVNYRKGLASLNLDYEDYTTGNDAKWGDPDYFKSFDPTLMEKYAANKSPNNVDGEKIISDAALATKSISNGWTQTPYAADPFLGVSGARVNPFYTFYCLDRAYEIKARIRMVVRDWDRVFTSTTSNLELISDTWVTPADKRIQDIPNDEDEYKDDPANFNLFNDKDDWDVLVEMTRHDPNNTGVYDWTPAYLGTLYYPTPGAFAPYLTSRWWDPTIFPNEGPAD